MKQTITALLLAGAALGCNAPATGTLGAGSASGSDPLAATPTQNTAVSETPQSGAPRGNEPTNSTVAGDVCAGSDPSQLCVALKYVVYTDNEGEAVVSREQAIQVVREMNAVWKQCKIAFQIDEYAQVKAEDFGLRYQTLNSSDLNVIRSTFENDHTLLIATTGTWDRSGSLGSTGANAWTNMPGEGVYGAVLERPVGTFSNIIAHEIGHYLNLDHANDASNLLNPIIYDTSSALYPSQCTVAREAINDYWPKMKR